MIDWKFDPKNYESDSYELIPAGDYRVRIEETSERVSQSGKEMIRMKLKVNGYNAALWYYLVFDSSSEESRKRTDQRLGSVYDSFQIERGNLNIQDWIGKTGGVRVKNKIGEDGETRSEVHYFLSRKKTEKLPSWDGEQPKDEIYSGMDSDIPF